MRNDARWTQLERNYWPIRWKILQGWAAFVCWKCQLIVKFSINTFWMQVKTMFTTQTTYINILCYALASNRIFATVRCKQSQLQITAAISNHCHHYQLHHTHHLSRRPQIFGGNAWLLLFLLCMMLNLALNASEVAPENSLCHRHIYCWWRHNFYSW